MCLRLLFDSRNNHALGRSYARSFLVSATLALALGLSLYAGGSQIRKLTGENIQEFSPATVSFNFQGFIEGAQAQDAYSAWGIHFSGSGTTLRIVKYQTSNSPNPFLITVSGIRNESNGFSVDESPLVISFRFPARRLGFSLSNGSPQTVATIGAFDSRGKFLGEISESNIPPPPMLPADLGDATFVGIEAVSEPIAFVTIDYGDTAPGEEQLDGLLVDFDEPPSFETGLAQFADGLFPNPDNTPGTPQALQTTIIITNPTEDEAMAVLSILDEEGNPLEVNLNGQAASDFDLTLQAFTSLSFDSSGGSIPSREGYARVVSSSPLDVSGIFRVLDRDGSPLAEAGVNGDRGQFLVTAPVQRMGGVINSGLAIANIGDSSAEISITFRPEVLAPGVLPQITIELRAGQHEAFFLDELFPGLADQEIRGLATVSSAQPILVTVLRTIGGVVSSSLQTSSP